MPKFSFSQGSDMLSGIKSKLGFSSSSGRDGYGDYDGYDGYGDYGDGSYDDGSYDDYSYESSASPVSTRRSGSRSASKEPSRPRLVSFDDVRAATHTPDPLANDPLAARHVVTTSDERPRSTTRDAIRASSGTLRSSSSRSGGYDSLFESTAAAASKKAAESASASTTSTVGGASSYDPHRAYEGAGVPVFTPERSITVIKPQAYDEVEQIAKALKAGDAVVLQLMNTQNALSKRVLDFSFGVSSALDATVECIADKVFVITRGKGLTDDERTKLRKQGVY